MQNTLEDKLLHFLKNGYEEQLVEGMDSYHSVFEDFKNRGYDEGRC